MEARTTDTARPNDHTEPPLTLAAFLGDDVAAAWYQRDTTPAQRAAELTWTALNGGGRGFTALAYWTLCDTVRVWIRWEQTEVLPGYPVTARRGGSGPFAIEVAGRALLADLAAAAGQLADAFTEPAPDGEVQVFGAAPAEHQPWCDHDHDIDSSCTGTVGGLSDIDGTELRVEVQDHREHGQPVGGRTVFIDNTGLDADKARELAALLLRGADLIETGSL
jgi:hypothetical protein